MSKQVNQEEESIPELHSEPDDEEEGTPARNWRETPRYNPSSGQS